MAADYEAFGAIVRSLRARIGFQGTVERVSLATDERSRAQGVAKVGVRISSSLVLSGLTVVERFYDPVARIHYSLAVIDLEAAAAPLRARLAELKRAYASALVAARESCSTGDIRPCLGDLTRAYSHARTFQELLPDYRLLRLADEGELAERDNPNPESVLELAASVASRVRMEKVGGDSQEGIVGKGLPAPLRLAVFLAAARPVPVRGALVRFRFDVGQGRITETALTDYAGLAEAVVHRLGRSPTESYSVVATLELGAQWGDTLPAELQRVLSRATQSVAFAVRPKKVALPLRALVVLDQPVAAEIMAAELNRVGFSALSEEHARRLLSPRVRQLLRYERYDEIARELGNSVQLIVVGSIEAAAVGEYQGVHVFGATGWAKVVSLESGRWLAEATVGQVRGFGVDGAQARANALRAGAQELAEEIVAELLAQM